jgi:hypothetical protein
MADTSPDSPDTRRAQLDAAITALAPQADANPALAAALAELQRQRNELTARDINTGGGDVVVGQKIEIHQHLSGTPPAQPAALSETAQQLYTLLADKWFGLNDLEELAFQLNLEWDNLPGSAKPAKARALVLACEQRDLTAKLKSLMRLARPNLREQLT